MKKTITITLIIALISCIFLSIPVSATTADNTERTIEYLDNGDYIETIITDDTANPGISLYATNTITKTKTAVVLYFGQLQLRLHFHTMAVHRPVQAVPILQQLQHLLGL